MTRSQVIQLVGQANVDEKNSKGDVLILRTAPKPHPAFEVYTLIISPELGVLKIGAVGVTISTSSFGTEIHNSFVEIRDAVSETYGKPSTEFDFVQSGSLWTEPNDWMMGLLKKERSLDAYWISKKAHPENGTIELPNDIGAISLEATALSTEKGYLTLTYELEGWEAYLEALKAKQNKAF